MLLALPIGLLVLAICYGIYRFGQPPSSNSTSRSRANRRRRRQAAQSGASSHAASSVRTLHPRASQDHLLDEESQASFDTARGNGEGEAHEGEKLPDGWGSEDESESGSEPYDPTDLSPLRAVEVDSEAKSMSTAEEPRWSIKSAYSTTSRGYVPGSTTQDPTAQPEHAATVPTRETKVVGSRASRQSQFAPPLTKGTSASKRD